VPVLYYLAGLTCTEETFMIKAGAQRVAAELGMMLVAPDYQPARLNLPGESDSWDFGVAAGFYVDATREPWSKHYRMYTYVTQELRALVEAQFPADPARTGIFGHSMGGHGALGARAEQPADLQVDLSVCADLRAQTGAVGPEGAQRLSWSDTGQWSAYDATEIMFGFGKMRCARPHLLVDQGLADQFLEKATPQHLFEAAAQKVG